MLLCRFLLKCGFIIIPWRCIRKCSPLMPRYVAIVSFHPLLLSWYAWPASYFLSLMSVFWVVCLHPECWRPVVWGPPELRPEPPWWQQEQIRWWCLCSAGRGAADASGRHVWSVTSIVTALPAFLLRGCLTDLGHPGAPPSAHPQAVCWVESCALLQVAWSVSSSSSPLPLLSLGYWCVRMWRWLRPWHPRGLLSPGP